MTIYEKFRAYHEGNPDIYDLFVRFSREVKATGRKRYSIWAVANRVRWHVDVQTLDSHTDFKISNDYLAHYAREIMAREQDLIGLFQTKLLTRA